MDEMMTSDLTQCAEDLRVGWGLMLAAEGQIAQGKAQWIEGVLKAAHALATARDAMKNDAEFGKWCSDNGLSLKVIDKDNRAALVRVGRNLPYWRDRLAEAKSQSLRSLIKDVPDEEVSQPAIPARHQTKPGPKPTPKVVSKTAAEAPSTVGEGRNVVAAMRRSDPLLRLLDMLGDAMEEAGLDTDEVEGDEDRRRLVIADRAFAVAWFKDALAAYDAAPPDEATKGAP
jgi:hypothetical protein